MTNTTPSAEEMQKALKDLEHFMASPGFGEFTSIAVSGLSISHLVSYIRSLEQANKELEQNRKMLVEAVVAKTIALVAGGEYGEDFADESAIDSITGRVFFHLNIQDEPKSGMQKLLEEADPILSYIRRLKGQVKDLDHDRGVLMVERNDLREKVLKLQKGNDEFRKALRAACMVIREDPKNDEAVEAINLILSSLSE